MQSKSQHVLPRVGWNMRVSWNGVIQLALILTLLASLFLTGSTAPRAASIDPNAQVAAGEESNKAVRIDPRIAAAATHTPEELVRVIVQKMSQDAVVEAMVVELGGSILSDLPIINAFAAELSADAAMQVALNPAVRWVSIDAAVQSTLFGGGGKSRWEEPSNNFLDTLNIPGLWDQGLSGVGIGVAVIDSGVYRDNDFKNLAKVKGFNLNSVTPIDLYGHGTHIAGIVAGSGRDSNGKFKGIAPDSTLIGLKVSNDLGLAFESDVVKALQWVYNNKSRYNIRVINLSINSGVETSYHNSALNAAAEVLWFNGVVVVVSAGNSGSGNKLNTVNAAPANDPFLITVGASDEMGTDEYADDTIAPYSAYGVTTDGYLKPDIVAPGTGIYSVLSKLSPWGLLYRDRVAHNGEYFRMSGTSMAAPMVVGVVALMLQDEPNLTPDQVKYRLIHGTDRTLSANVNGETVPFAYMDGAAAVNSASTESANTGLQASQLLWSGSEPINWSSVNWNSVNWNSVNWNSVNWNSVNWNSTVLEPPTIGGILPLAEGDSWVTPQAPTEVPNVEFAPELDDQIDAFLYLPSLNRD